MSTNLAINEFDFLMRHSLMAFVEYTFAELFPQTPFRTARISPSLPQSSKNVPQASASG